MEEGGENEGENPEAQATEATVAPSEGSNPKLEPTASNAQTAQKPATPQSSKPATPTSKTGTPKSKPGTPKSKQGDSKSKTGASAVAKGKKDDKTKEEPKKGDKKKDDKKKQQPKKPKTPWVVKKDPCYHEFCNPPKSDPSHYPKGMPWASGKLKCLPGHCKDFKDESEEEKLAKARKEEDDERKYKMQLEKCRRQEKQTSIDEAKAELAFFMKLLYLTNDKSLVENFKKKVKKDEPKKKSEATAGENPSRASAKSGKEEEVANEPEVGAAPTPAKDGEPAPAPEPVTSPEPVPVPPEPLPEDQAEPPPEATAEPPPEATAEPPPEATAEPPLETPTEPPPAPEEAPPTPEAPPEPEDSPPAQ